MKKIDKKLVPGIEKDKGKECFTKQDYEGALNHYAKVREIWKILQALILDALILNWLMGFGIV